MTGWREARRGGLPPSADMDDGVTAVRERGVRYAGLAIGLPLAAIALLWLWPSVGLVAAIIVVSVLAPWGQRLGERVIVTVVAALALVALPLIVTLVLGRSVPPEAWRVLLTVVLVGCSALLYRRPRTVPVWPEVRWEDAVAIATGTLVTTAMVLPILVVDPAKRMSALLIFWDNSSHLPMFAQVMHAGGWNVDSLGDDLLFSVYPMLHVGVWSVGEWVSGAGLDTPGLDLITPYAMWSGLTAGIAAALVVWASALVARSVARGWEWLAAVFTASWCLLGSLTAMADYAFSNFLVAAAVAIAAVAVGARSAAAVRSLGWWTLPLAAVVVGYLYPPVVGGVMLAALVWWFVLMRSRDRLRVRFTAALAVAVVALIPALRFVTEPFAGRQAGAITGGMPLTEWALALVLAVTVPVVLLIVRRDRTVPSRLALSMPVLVATAIASVFAAQAVVAGLPLARSYYTLKVIYALLLCALPIAMALAAAAWGARQPARQANLAVVVVMAVVIGLITVPSGGGWKELPGVGVSAPVPATMWATLRRLRGPEFDVTRGAVTLRAVEVAEDGWVTLPVYRQGYPLTDSLMAAGLGALLTRALNAVANEAWRKPSQVGALMRANPALRIQFVVAASVVPDNVLALQREFGPERVRVEIVR